MYGTQSTLVSFPDLPNFSSPQCTCILDSESCLYKLQIRLCPFPSVILQGLLNKGKVSFLGLQTCYSYPFIFSSFLPYVSFSCYFLPCCYWAHFSSLFVAFSYFPYFSLFLKMQLNTLNITASLRLWIELTFAIIVFCIPLLLNLCIIL